MAVQSVAAAGDGFEVTTDQGVALPDAVVLATGACNLASVPAAADGLPRRHPPSPRSPTGAPRAPPTGVLVVGARPRDASWPTRSTGRAGPSRCRSASTFACPAPIGAGTSSGGSRRPASSTSATTRSTTSSGRATSRRRSSGGVAERADLDLDALRRGVRVVGRLAAIVDGVAQFSGSLTNVCRCADLKLRRLLQRLDEWAEASGVAEELGEPEPVEPTAVPSPPLLELELRSGEVGSVVWATGYRPDHSWLDVPVLDRRGRIRHQGGVVERRPGST